MCGIIQKLIEHGYELFVVNKNLIIKFDGDNYTSLKHYGKFVDDVSGEEYQNEMIYFEYFGHSKTIK